ncbi:MULTISPECIES: hypothetical protein [Achromobacter]|uniref:Uncharacterized protein n=1 Tax=Achromobacter xylosoxidans (strain A8) TaxID=762376 RepID=E3HYL2_ACHXA|nr:hypothetical protein [Achromobacter xylosoxidans]ADP20166.1 hypothetical protein AXYL_06884 [Achromobacter xylosoxidans A8]
MKASAGPTQSAHVSQSGSGIFDSQLAQILFGTPPPLGRAGIEARAVEKFASWFASQDAMSDVRLAAYLKKVDSRLLPKLSGRAILQILQTVERRRPRLLPAIALSGAWKQSLSQARVYSDLLKPSTLARLATALETERYDDH